MASPPPPDRSRDAIASYAGLTRFWFPLAASWLLMGVEGPVVQASIAHMTEGVEQKVQLAAFGMVFFLEVLVEAPVIMLLATSTALARDAAAYRCLRRFAFHLGLGLTVVAVALAFFRPLFDLVVRDVLNGTPAVAEAVRPGLVLMIPWSMCIGIRRFFQGLLIRQGQTRRVVLGTALRCVASCSTALSLAHYGSFTGVEVGAMALVAGVGAEVVFTAWLARPAIRRVLATAPDPARPAVSYGEVVRFHAPLAATSVLSLVVQPAALASLGRMPGAEDTLASWPVVFAILMFFHSGSYALPETLIARAKDGVPGRRLAGFGLRVGVVTAVLLALFAGTSLAHDYLLRVKGLEADLASLVTMGLKVAVIVPLFHCTQNLLRGLRVASSSTRRVYVAMMVHIGIVVTGFLMGVWWQAPGISYVLAVLALAYVTESLVLWRGLRGAMRAAGLRW